MRLPKKVSVPEKNIVTVSTAKAIFISSVFITLRDFIIFQFSLLNLTVETFFLYI